MTCSVASALRQVIWTDSYSEAPDTRRHVGVDDHHAAPILDPVAQGVLLHAMDELFDEYVIMGDEIAGGQIMKGRDTGDLCFIADALDGSAFARHRIPLASCSLCAYSRSDRRAIASAVTDILLGLTYYTADHLDGAYLEFAGTGYPIHPSGCTRIEAASCAVLAAQPDRLFALASQERLIQSVRWVLNSCGAIMICRVASGDLDFAAEFAKGFRIWDVAAASHVLEKAGGVFRDSKGKRIVLSANLGERNPFIAAATQALFDQVQDTIRWGE